MNPPFSDGDLNAIYTDTSTVISITVRDDSLRTDETSRALFGRYNDPVFGLTEAFTYSQFQLSTTQLEFPSGAVLDSVVVRLAYDGLYGASEQMMNMQIFEITEAISEDVDYFNYSTLSFDPVPVASIDFVPDLTDTASVDSTELDPFLQIRLNDVFAQKLFNRAPFSSNDDFTDFFKGFYLLPDTNKMLSSGEGSLLYFDLLSPTSKVIFYYEFNDEQGNPTSANYELIVGSSTPRFNRFTHEYTGTEIENSLNRTDLEVNYVQPLAGVKTKITFPNLLNFTSEGNIAVNKAELVITVKEGSTDELPPAERLILLTQNEDGNNVFLPDFFEGTDFFGGEYDINSNTYVFNIARYVDELINERKEDRGLFLIVSGNVVNANRTILNSGISATDQLKLRLTFTE